MASTILLQINGDVPRNISLNPKLSTSEVVMKIYEDLNEAISLFLELKEDDVDNPEEELRFKNSLLEVSRKLEHIIESNDYGVILPTDYVSLTKEEAKDLVNAKMKNSKEVDTSLFKLLEEANNIIEFAKKINSLEPLSDSESFKDNMIKVLEEDMSVKKDGMFKKNSVANIIKQELNVQLREESYGFALSRIYFKATGPSEADILFGEIIEKY